MDFGDLVAQGHKEAVLDDRWANRSFGEGQLAELVRQCWNEDSKQRPSIGEIVLRLRSVLRRHGQNADSSSTNQQ